MLTRPAKPLRALPAPAGGVRCHKKEKFMEHVDLFPLLHNRMNKEEESVPEYIGEFDGVSSLPKGDYPAIYFWVDRDNSNSVRLSFNTPKLERWCMEEAVANGFNADSIEPNVEQALATLQQC